MNPIWTPAQLAMFAKVVDLNGFSAAARALGVPKAAVSRAVADLERTLGVRVLERTTRRIALTAAGRLLYPHARRVGEQSDAACTAIARLHSPEGRPLRVVADPTYGRVLLAPLVPRFLEAFAQVIGTLRRSALLQVLRRGAQQRRRCAEQTANDRIIRRWVRADGHIPRALRRLPGIECNFERHLRERLEKARHERCEQYTPVGRIRDDPQRTAFG